MFRKILIANRGEIALRIIRACREMGIKTVAVYSEADKDSLHVWFADEAICIGPPPAAESYLNIPRIISAAVISGADAIHPGYGFLAENAQFAELCEKSGFKFIGPKPDQIRKMGDKMEAKRIAKQAGVPTVPGSDGVVKDIDTARQIARQIGFPILLKAAAGGGGKSMRIVESEKELERAFEQAYQEAKAAFGRGDLYMEKFLEEPRHIEIQVAGDQYGTVCHLPERECSIQRKYQKLIEESPSPFMTPELREEMGNAALRLIDAIKYENMGTVEFLVDRHRNFYFIEMNTRIQVEHPVTEEVMFYDLIKEQIKIAAGVAISGKNYYPQRHAIECRINAEDPAKNFIPSPGTIQTLYLPGGRGVRIDTHIYAGYTIPPHYDSMIAKVIAVGLTREEAINTMIRALEEFYIEGIQTTIPLHLHILRQEAFRRGNYNTHSIREFMKSFRPAQQQ